MAKPVTSKDILESLVLSAGEDIYGEEFDFQEVEEEPYAQAATVLVKIGRQVFRLEARYVHDI